MSTVLGIDVGGSGIKGAPVDLEAGDFAEPRLRIVTPNPSSPKNVAAVISEIVANYADTIGDGPVGISLPAPIRHGVVAFMANLDQKWTGLNAEEYLSDKLGRPVTVLNDADAAGVAEVHFGAASGVPGVVILTTLGTGIGSAIINDGVLLPNTELGHLEIDGHDAEKRAASSVKDRKHMSYKEWATKRLQRYYEVVEMLFSPDLLVVGHHMGRLFGRRSVSSHVATTDSISLTGLVPRHRPHSRGEEHHIILDHQRREHTRRSTVTPAS